MYEDDIDEDRMWVELMKPDMVMPCFKKNRVDCPIMPVTAVVGEGPGALPVAVRARTTIVEELME
jgi:hypothetical protein